jgi:cytochrome c peroxidase
MKRVLTVLWVVRIALTLSACESKVLSADEVAAVLASEANVEASPDADAQAEAVAFNPRLLRRFKPLRDLIETDENPSTQAKVELGRMLYFETRLSKNQDLSCNSCHPLESYGADGQRTSPGHRGQRGQRNSPTVYNAAGQFAQFWDGRVETIEEQAPGPMVNPVEMALTSGEAAEQVLRSMPEYRQRFAAAFPEAGAQSITTETIGKAIGAFERGLVTPSRWDAYLKGDKGALSAKEIAGLTVFTNVGCMVCHTGEFLGGSMFEKAGVVEDWANQDDQGRFAVSKKGADKMMFKVPTLRNVEKTAPYFHDGSAATLDEAVATMGRHQLGLDLSWEERDAIVAWLKALTGPLPTDYIRAPVLPASTPQTPRPDPS